MGLTTHCKSCGQIICLYQNIDGSWTAFEDDTFLKNHFCKKIPPIEKKLGCIFNIGSCSRRIGYKILAPQPYEFNFKDWEAFYIGRVGEGYIKDILIRKGYKIFGKQRDLSFMGFTGRIDGAIILRNELYVLECKTIFDSAKFQSFIESDIKEEHPRYYAQIQAYLAAAKSNKCLMIVMGNESGPLQLHEKIIRFDANFLSGLRLRIKNIVERIDKGELPKADPFMKPYTECQYCESKHYCEFKVQSYVGFSEA